MANRPTVRLLPATIPLLDALLGDRALFGELIGSPAPEGWPEFSEAIPYTREHLEKATEADRRWSMRFWSRRSEVSAKSAPMRESDE